MRHLATFLLALALVGSACGPRPDPTTPASPPTASATGVAPSSPAPGSPQAGATEAEAALRSLWSDPVDEFSRKMLLKSRQQDSPAADIQNMVVENVVKPMGPIQEIQPLPVDEFNESGMLAVGFYPSVEANEKERKRYGDSVDDTFWRIRTAKGDVLASVTTAPGEDGEPRVQAMILKADELGSPLTEDTERDRKAAEKILGLVRAGKAEDLLGAVSASSFRDRLTVQTLTKAMAPLREALADKGAATFDGGKRWYSIVGWTRSYEYQVPGRKGPVQVVISFDEDDGLLTGLAWTGPDGKTEEI